VLFTAAVASGAAAAIDQEVLLRQIPMRRKHLRATRDAGDNAATIIWYAVAYVLQEKIVIVPFVKGYFGTPRWRLEYIWNCGRASSQCRALYDNALGNGPVAVNPYTTTNDSGLRPNGGGQFSFQITGYLAIQTAPLRL